MTKTLVAILLPALAGVTASSAPGAQVIPQGTYRYETTVAAQAVGTSTIVVRHDRGVIRVGESGSLSGHTLVSDRKIEEATFATLSYSADAGGKHVVVSLADDSATLSADGASSKISAAHGAPFLVNDNMVAGFLEIPAMLHVTGASQLTLACVCGAFVAVPVTVSGRSEGAVTISVEGAAATLSFDPHSYVLNRFDLPSQQLSILLKSYDSAIAPPH